MKDSLASKYAGAIWTTLNRLDDVRHVETIGEARALGFTFPENLEDDEGLDFGDWPADDSGDSLTLDHYIDNALAINRSQALVEGVWETSGYQIVVAVGGPYAEVDTERSIIRVVWDETFERALCKSIVDAIDSTLDDYFGE